MRRKQHEIAVKHRGGERHESHRNSEGTFQKQGEGTRTTLVHSVLPDADGGRGHEKGWNYFLDMFHVQFTGGSRKIE
jgi:Activator of Hsp90 ATPase homolog 1-like protein